MKVLITGGAGFIGTAFTKLLIERSGAEVVAFDNLLQQVHPTGRPPEDFPAQARLVKGDIRDMAALDALLSGFSPDYVVHFAAETGTGQSMHEASRHASVNVVGTAELLDALHRNNIVPKRLLLSSSRAVYGEGAWISAKDDKFYPGARTQAQLAAAEWDFNAPDGSPARPAPHDAASVNPNPTSIYGATKLAQEHVMAAWAAAHDVPLSVLRFQNVYGPGQSPNNPYTGIVNIFHQIARRGEVIPVYEDGNIGRDFVFIDDVVDACAAALLSPAPGKTSYDVGSGVVLTIHDIARVIARMHKAPEPQICGKFRVGDVRWAVAAVQPLADDLNVLAKVPFATGVQVVGEWLFLEKLATIAD
jgi:dTDP-L-rhamnose 4-epimerase